MSEFEEAKLKKARGYTIKDALKDAEDSRDVIIVHVSEDGLVNLSFSVEHPSVPYQLGLLEMGKQILLDHNS